MVNEEQIAKLFHETYERLAPEHGYKTRTKSAVPWEQVPENNRNLMIATVKEVLANREVKFEEPVYLPLKYLGTIINDTILTLVKKAIGEWSTDDGRIFNGQSYSQADCVMRVTTLMAVHEALEGDTSSLEDLAYDTKVTKIKH